MVAGYQQRKGSHLYGHACNATIRCLQSAPDSMSPHWFRDRDYLLCRWQIVERAVELSSESIRTRLRRRLTVPNLDRRRDERPLPAPFRDLPLLSCAALASSSPPRTPTPLDLREATDFSRTCRRGGFRVMAREECSRCGWGRRATQCTLGLHVLCNNRWDRGGDRDLWCETSTSISPVLTYLHRCGVDPGCWILGASCGRWCVSACVRGPLGALDQEFAQ
jgi:hypothetical protein